MNNIIELAIETGMRRSEILSITNNDIKDNCIYLSDTKNNSPRKIPLTKKVKEIINKSILPYSISSNAVRLSWYRMIKRAGIVDLHFHDLRHEAISRFFEKGLSIPEVSLISGHAIHIVRTRSFECRNSIPASGAISRRNMRPRDFCALDSANSTLNFSIEPSAVSMTSSDRSNLISCCAFKGSG